MRKRKLDVTKRIHKPELLALHYPFIDNSVRAGWLIWATILNFDWQMIVSLFVLQVDWLNDSFIFVFLKLDFDECGGNNNHCHQNAICTNTIGSYSCRCSVGYAGDGFLCRGIKFEDPSRSFSFNSWSIIIKDPNPMVKRHLLWV